ncbi:MAG TPA: helix-turn-helix transcriptional regulator [Thermoanaerobaculia bacterium]
MAGLSFSDEYGEMLVLLRRARKAVGLTQADVARAFKRTQGAISKMEAGEIRIDPIELQRFVELYRVEVTALLPGGKPEGDS